MRTKAEKVKSWAIEVIKNGSWKNYNDLHIDEIDKKYKKNKKKWISSGIIFFDIAKQFIEDKNLPFIVQLDIPLEIKVGRGNYVIENINELENELSDTPPSLYLFHEDHEASMRNQKAIMQILDNFIDNTKNRVVQYCESYDEEYDEVNRGVYLTSGNN